MFFKRLAYQFSYVAAFALLICQNTVAQENLTNIQSNAQLNVKYRAGDYKANYDEHYRTQSLSVDYRTKHQKASDLIINNQRAQLGLPLPPVPDDNGVTRDKIALGKKLFFDRRLSLNNTFSCAMCHIPEQGFTNNELTTPVGFEGRIVRRNAPTLYNSAYFKTLFHDGREDNLELQVWQPLLAANEMANSSFASVINKLNTLPDYQGLFEQAFNGTKADVVTIGKALASYERMLVSANANFDKWYYAKNNKAMSAQAQQGFALFMGKGKCVLCHQVGSDYALFTDNEMHNTGVGFMASMMQHTPYINIQVSPGEYINVEHKRVLVVADPLPNDIGRYEITQNPDDRWKYKTSSLRNISLTAPYMHNGSLTTLEEVIDFYNQGGVSHAQLSPLIQPLGLSVDEKQALLTFLNNLTGDNVDELVADAFSVPIGDVR